VGGIHSHLISYASGVKNNNNRAIRKKVPSEHAETKAHLVAASLTQVIVITSNKKNRLYIQSSEQP
jgi:hypothetical protein